MRGCHTLRLPNCGRHSGLVVFGSLAADSPTESSLANLDEIRFDSLRFVSLVHSSSDPPHHRESRLEFVSILLIFVRTALSSLIHAPLPPRPNVALPIRSTPRASAAMGNQPSGTAATGTGEHARYHRLEEGERASGRACETRTVDAGWHPTVCVGTSHALNRRDLHSYPCCAAQVLVDPHLPLPLHRVRMQ
jgi:hypothetical protein